MKSLWAIVFIVGYFVCANGSQHAGGLMNGDGSYIPGILMQSTVNGCCQVRKVSKMLKKYSIALLFPGSALVWADVARKTMRFSDVVGYHTLQYWFSQIEALNRDVGNASNPTAEILQFFNLANDMIGRLQVHIRANLKLAHRYAIIHTKLKDLLGKVRNEDATVMDVNNYMIDAFPKLMSAINSNK